MAKKKKAPKLYSAEQIQNIYEMGRRDGKKELADKLVELLGIQECFRCDENHL